MITIQYHSPRPIRKIFSNKTIEKETLIKIKQLKSIKEENS